jgi:uncharacterized membrane protein
MEVSRNIKVALVACCQRRETHIKTTLLLIAGLIAVVFTFFTKSELFM